MNFSEALKAMEMGNKVSRETWRGRISCWYLKHEEAGGDTSGIITQIDVDGKEHPVVDFGTDNPSADDWWIVT